MVNQPKVGLIFIYSTKACYWRTIGPDKGILLKSIQYAMNIHVFIGAPDVFLNYSFVILRSFLHTY